MDSKQGVNQEKISSSKDQMERIATEQLLSEAQRLLDRISSRNGNIQQDSADSKSEQASQLKSTIDETDPKTEVTLLEGYDSSEWDNMRPVTQRYVDDEIRRAITTIKETGAVPNVPVTAANKDYVDNEVNDVKRTLVVLRDDIVAQIDAINLSLVQMNESFSGLNKMDNEIIARLGRIPHEYKRVLDDEVIRIHHDISSVQTELTNTLNSIQTRSNEELLHFTGLVKEFKENTTARLKVLEEQVPHNLPESFKDAGSKLSTMEVAINETQIKVEAIQKSAKAEVLKQLVFKDSLLKAFKQMSDLEVHELVLTASSSSLTKAVQNPVFGIQFRVYRYKSLPSLIRFTGCLRMVEDIHSYPFFPGQVRDCLFHEPLYGTATRIHTIDIGSLDFNMGKMKSMVKSLAFILDEGGHLIVFNENDNLFIGDNIIFDSVFFLKATPLINVDNLPKTAPDLKDPITGSPFVTKKK